MEETTKSKTTKNKILDAAATVFGRMGIHKARMDDIVEEAGVSKGGLYWHFKSKDEIIIQIIGKIMDKDMGKIRKKFSEDKPASEKLYDVIEITGRDLMKIKPLIPLGFEFVAKAFREPVIRTLIKKYYDLGREIFSEFIVQGIESGEFRQIDPDEASNTIVALLEGIILVSLVDDELDVWLERATSATDIFLNGIQS